MFPLDPTRRRFLTDLTAGSSLLLAGCSRSRPAGVTEPEPGGAADVTLHIGTVQAEIAKDHTVRTLGYLSLIHI